ncbi:pyridoxine 5'-phosphate synthase, partial [Nostoc sp. NIES-2111]
MSETDHTICRLSVNVNKIALLRNSRGGNRPDLLTLAADIERYGAHGITVHPRPDERHVRFDDLAPLKAQTVGEFNIEGYPDERWMQAVLAIRPAQATLVPDPPGALTSSAGWDTTAQRSRLTEICSEFRRNGIRASIFIDADPRMAEGAAAAGADRIELYTGPYAEHFPHNREAAIAPYLPAAAAAHAAGLGINAGHDLDLNNLAYFHQQIPHLAEVSIGHAIISDALYFGLENVVRMYLHQLNKK